MDEGVGDPGGREGSESTEPQSADRQSTGSPGWRHRLAVGVLLALGLSTFAVHAYHLAVADFPPLGVAFGVAIPMVVSATLVGCGLWLARAGFGPLSARAAAWSLAGATTLVAITSANVAFQGAVGGTLEGLSVVIVVQGSVGALLGFLLGVYDVKRLETRRELLAERHTATRLSRRLNVLNRVLRHDIRNKVNVIRGNADLVAAGTDQTETAAETIREQADELFRLSEYARELEALLGRDGVETGAVDVGTAVSTKVMRLRRDHGYATIHTDVEEGAWAEANAFVDSAIENLLDNAVVHNDGTSPTVWVEVATEERDGEPVVAVRVADDGPGIPPEEVDVLRRGHETSLEHTSGLGLWLVHWIVTESGGSVTFEERDPRGSVVEMTLPRTEPDDDATAPRRDPVSAVD